MNSTSIIEKKGGRNFVLFFRILIIIIIGISHTIILSKSLYAGENIFIKREKIEPIEFYGLSVIDYTSDQNNSSSLAEVTVPSGVSHKVSWSNRSDKYYYVVRGNVLFTVEGESCDLSTGDVCVIRKGERFSYTNTGPNDAILVLVHTPNFLLEYEMFEEAEK